MTGRIMTRKRIGKGDVISGGVSISGSFLLSSERGQKSEGSKDIKGIVSHAMFVGGACTVCRLKIDDGRMYQSKLSRCLHFHRIGRVALAIRFVLTAAWHAWILEIISGAKPLPWDLLGIGTHCPFCWLY